ncbi:LYR motif-containing protein At3g19508 [Vitis vinifera]|nr:LYR motif-containing protein At3g19508 [Vitis vinifera]
MYQEQVNNRERVCRWKFETWERMKKALKAYGAVLRLVRRLPKDTRPYYAKYARENFVNYREVDAADPNALNDLFNRTYTHSLWVLNKYSVDQAAADKLKEICCS